MTKKLAKTATKTAAKKTASSPKANSSADSGEVIEKASVQALKTLESLGIEQQLQQDIEWCLGSYRHDKNPEGLFEMTQRALIALQTAKERKAKGVTVKLLGDLEKALQSR